MKTLKITLLLAVFCIALTGVTYSNDAKDADIEQVESFDMESKDVQIAGDLKKAKKPPQA